MPVVSDQQRKMIFARRDQYGSKDKTPDKWEWIWDKGYEEPMKKEENMKRYIPYFNEDISISLNKGDSFLWGKWKNKIAVFDHLDKDEKGQDIIITDTGKKIPLLKIRLIRENLNNKILFHGSNNIFDSFNIKKAKRGKAIFLTPNKIDAESYGKNIYKVQILRDNLFDYNNNHDIVLLMNCVNQQLIIEKDKPYNKRIDFYPYTKQQVFEGIKKGKWNFLSHPIIILCLKKLKYNGYIELEGDRISYAFFNPVDLKIIDKFNENLRFSDLMKKASLSPFTLDYNKETNKLMGPPTTHTKLKGIKVNKKKDYVIFIWKTKRTPKYDNKKQPMKAVDPKDEFKMKKANFYTIEIKVIDFFKLLKTKPDNNFTNKDIEEVFNVADIQVWSSVPAYQYQGMNYNMTLFDASIYPEIREPKIWNKLVSKYGKIHNEYQFLDKHTAGVVNSIKFYIPQMRQMIKKYLDKK